MKLLIQYFSFSPFRSLHAIRDGLRLINLLIERISLFREEAYTLGVVPLLLEIVSVQCVDDSSLTMSVVHEVSKPG
jgi:hypothetical protein